MSELYPENSPISSNTSSNSSNDSDESSVGFHYPLSDNQVINDHIIINKLGSGRFCRVYKVKKNDQYFALKIYKSSDDYFEYYQNELKNHNLIKNDPSYKTYFSYIIEDFIIQSEYGFHGCIIFDLCGDNLAQLLDKNKDSSLPHPIVKQITKQLLNGLKVLHNINLIHTDIKPENILLTTDVNNIKNFSDINIKIIDLGSSMLENEIDTYSVGTDQYLPPEVILRANYNKSIDIWAIGNIIFELMTGDNLIDPSVYYDSESDYDDDSECGNIENDEDNGSTNSSICSDDDDEDCGNYEYVHTHIGLFHKIFGPIPQNLISNGENYEYFFKKSGKLNRVPSYIDDLTMEEIITTEYSFDNDKIKNEFIDILKFIFKYNLHERPNIEQLLNHKYFKGNFEAEFNKLKSKK